MSCVASLSACKNARFSTSKPYYTSFLSIDQTLLCKFHMIVLLVFTFKLGLFLEVSSVAYDTVCSPSHQTDICCIKTTRSQNSSLVLGIFHFREYSLYFATMKQTSSFTCWTLVAAFESMLHIWSNLESGTLQFLHESELRQVKLIP